MKYNVEPSKKDFLLPNTSANPPHANVKQANVRLKELTTHCNVTAFECSSELIDARTMAVPEMDVGTTNTANRTQNNSIFCELLVVTS